MLVIPATPILSAIGSHRGSGMWRRRRLPPSRLARALPMRGHRRRDGPDGVRHRHLHVARRAPEPDRHHRRLAEAHLEARVRRIGAIVRDDALVLHVAELGVHIGHAVRERRRHLRHHVESVATRRDLEDELAEAGARCAAS